MNGNSSKQVLLSVLGIAILVVAVVGVSFAFFSYTKTGTQNNVLTTGEIYTYLTEGNTTTLSNAMPVKVDLTSSTLTTTNQADVAALNFTVYGKNMSNDAIYYSIYLDEVSASDAGVSSRTALYREDVMLIMGVKVDGSTTYATADSTNGPILTNALSSAISVAQLEGKAASATKVTDALSKKLIATGKFAGVASNSTASARAAVTEHTHAYTLNMYVGDSATISDTDTTVNSVPTKYCASRDNTSATPTPGTNPGCEADVISAVGGENARYFSESYYSVRIRIVANTTNTSTATGYDYGL